MTASDLAGKLLQEQHPDDCIYPVPTGVELLLELFAERSGPGQSGTRSRGIRAVYRRTASRDRRNAAT